MIALAAEARALAVRLDSGEEVDASEVASLSERAMRSARGLDAAAGRDLAQAVQELLHAVQRSLARMGEGLKTVGTARKAARGYGSLRSNTLGQRTAKRA